ncbi:MAG: hypothetical protein WC069_00510 [Candidatus Shapirobacteria bacterium]
MIVINELIWDEFNLNHIQKHNVTQLEIVEASQKIILILESKFKRLAIIGKTKNNRLITFILDKKNNDNYYLVTARDTSRMERRTINEKNNKK